MADCPNAPGQPCTGGGWSIKTWTPFQWGIAFTAFFTAFATGVNAVLSTINHVTNVDNSQKLDAVHGQQIDNAKAVKDELATRSAVTDQKLGAIQKVAEKTQSTVADTLGPQLLASYKYLQELADYDPKDAQAAARAKDAKKTYDDYIAKQKSSK